MAVQRPAQARALKVCYLPALEIYSPSLCGILVPSIVCMVLRYERTDRQSREVHSNGHMSAMRAVSTLVEIGSTFTFTHTYSKAGGAIGCYSL